MRTAQEHKSAANAKDGCNSRPWDKNEIFDMLGHFSKAKGDRCSTVG